MTNEELIKKCEEYLLSISDSEFNEIINQCQEQCWFPMEELAEKFKNSSSENILSIIYEKTRQNLFNIQHKFFRKVDSFSSIVEPNSYSIEKLVSSDTIVWKEEDRRAFFYRLIYCYTDVYWYYKPEYMRFLISGKVDRDVNLRKVITNNTTRLKFYKNGDEVACGGGAGFIFTSVSSPLYQELIEYLDRPIEAAEKIDEEVVKKFFWYDESYYEKAGNYVCNYVGIKDKENWEKYRTPFAPNKLDMIMCKRVNENGSVDKIYYWYDYGR